MIQMVAIPVIDLMCMVDFNLNCPNKSKGSYIFKEIH